MRAAQAFINMEYPGVGVLETVKQSRIRLGGGETPADGCTFDWSSIRVRFCAN